jgi:hypothetical protein
VLAESQLRIDPFFERRQALLLDPRDLGLRERKLGKRLTAKQAQRLAQQRRRLRRLRAVRSLDEVLEAREVELARLDAGCDTPGSLRSLPSGRSLRSRETYT